MKTVLKYVKNYKKDSILTIVFTMFEVFMEVLLPFVTSYIIDRGIEANNINNVYKYGGLMLVMAALSLAVRCSRRKIRCQGIIRFCGKPEKRYL